MKVTYTGKGLYRIGDVTMKFSGKEYNIDDCYMESIKKAEKNGFLTIENSKKAKPKAEVKVEPKAEVKVEEAAVEQETVTIELNETPEKEETSEETSKANPRRRGRRKKA